MHYLTENASKKAMDPASVKQSMASALAGLSTKMQQGLEETPQEVTQNTDIGFETCRTTKVNLCPSLNTMCEKRQSPQLCDKLNNLCEKTNLEMITRTCLTSEAQVCQVGLALCQDKKHGMCDTLQKVCGSNMTHPVYD